MTKCVDCGGDVSSLASACPKCGAPPPNPPAPQPTSPIVQYGGAFIGVLVCFAIFSSTGLMDRILEALPFGEPGGRVVPVEFSQLLSDYDRNTVAADGKYKDLTISTAGNVVSVDRSYAGGIRLMLNNGPWSFDFADAYLLDSQANGAASLKPSNAVKLKCVVSGGPGGRPQLRRCVIQ